MASLVTVHHIHNITPASATPQPCWISLSNIDLLSASTYYSSFIYFYSPPNDPQTFNAVISELRHSLALTLNHYYVFAGRIQLGSDGRPQVNCNDTGIPLRVASTKSRFDDWKTIEECSIEQLLNTQDQIGTNSPLLQIQITRFACGGLALGGALCENVADAYSTAEFIHAWSRIHRGLSIDEPLFIAGEVFQPRNPPKVTVPMRDYVAEKPDKLIKYRIDDASHTYEKKIITLTAAGAKALIREIETGPFSFGRTTSFVAFSALVWKAITEARQLPDNVTTKFMYPVSCRGNRRFRDPPVPMNVFGNAIHLPVLAARAGEIKSRHISFAAKLIQDDIAKIDAEYIQSAIDWMEIQRQKGLESAFNMDYYGGKDVNCTTLHTFSVFNIDFGWGQPVHFTLVPDPWFGDGTAYFMPTPEGGKARKVALCMPKRVMDRFLSNKMVMRFTGYASSVLDRNLEVSTTSTGDIRHANVECCTNELFDSVALLHTLFTSKL